MLYEYLKNRAQAARFHMPGHKGVPVLGCPPETLDLTELCDTGNLYDAADDIIKASERLAAADYAADGCVFLAGGSTLGIQAVMGVCATSARRRVLVVGAAHMALYNACALLDYDVAHVAAPQSCGLPHDAAALIEAELLRGGCNVVFATSPDYYGRLCDTAAIHGICRRYGVPFVLDAAHGAHLAWFGIFQSADYIIMSAHKTLAALGGAAMVCCYGGDAAEVRRFARVFGSSSPSYLILASLDRALCELRRSKGEEYREVAARVAPLAAAGDPTRLYIACDGMDSFAFSAALQARGVHPEMADRGGVILIVTPADLGANLDALFSAFATLPTVRPAVPPLHSPPPLPRVMSLRGASLCRTRRVKVAQSEGCVAAQTVQIYPPGLPVILPGERITEKILAFLQDNMYNIEESIAVVVEA